MPLTLEPISEDAKTAFLKTIGDQPVDGLLHSLVVYAATLRRLASGEGLSSARKVGWQFLTTQGANAVSGDVPGQPMANGSLAASVSRGPTIATAWRAYESLAVLEQVMRATFKPRMLRIPGLHIEAYWLKSESDELDCVVPFIAYAEELSVRGALTRLKFEEIVQGLAKRQLALRDPRP